MQPPGRHDDDRAKTGCVGVLLPVAGMIYGGWIMLRKEGFRNYGIRPVRGAEAVDFGISVIGMALFVHALGFVPYRRHPVVRISLIVISIVLFFKGLLW